MRRVWVCLIVLVALAVSGCSSSTFGSPASPTPSSPATISQSPTSSPSSARTYSRSELVRSADRIMAASRAQQIPAVAVVALRHDMTGVTAYFERLPDDDVEMAATLRDIAGVPVGVAQGDPPKPT